MSYRDIECPYCDAGQEINHDDGHSYTEDETFQQECDECEKVFVYTTYISFNYDAQKADCLNGSDHQWRDQKVHEFERYKIRKRCSVCAETTYTLKEAPMFNQEKIFKFLWPDKCWHKWVKHDPTKLSYKCKHCDEVTYINLNINSFNPDLTKPDGMDLILDRLDELGYDFSVMRVRRGEERAMYSFEVKGGYTYLQCSWCCAQGPDGFNKKDAVKQWNRRTP